MLLLTPTTVRFDDLIWHDCSAIAIDREAARVIEDWGDDGPHAAFVDLPERRLRIKLTRELSRSEPGNELGAAVGRLSWLSVHTANAGSDAGRQRLRIRCVLAGVSTSIIHPSGPRGAPPSARQVITFIGVSPDGGAADPVQIAPAIASD